MKICHLVTTTLVQLFLIQQPRNRVTQILYQTNMSWEFCSFVTSKWAFAMGVGVNFTQTVTPNHRQICQQFPICVDHVLIRIIKELLVRSFQMFIIISIIVALLSIITFSAPPLIIIPEDLKLHLSPVHKEVPIASQIRI